MIQARSWSAASADAAGGIPFVTVCSDFEQPGAATPEADRIVEEVLAGDTQAFAGLVRLFQESVWRIGASMLRDRDATENLVQQVFVDAYLHLNQYEPGTDFGAWIRTVARNRLRKELRTAAREDRRLAAYRERLADRLRAEGGERPDELEAYMAALRGCRQLLPDRDAVLLRKRYERGMSFEAIASEQGQTPEAVQRMISRIRFRLRDCIQKKLTETNP
jgi:RNA polymerase sigma-70 factor (ECF subfamily)